MSILAETDDADLLTLVRDGDARAMAELWSRHYPATLAAARRVSRQPRDAEEFASDAFAGMLQAVSNDGGPSASVRGYLLVAVRNQAANRARRSSASDVLTDEITDYEDTGRDGPDPVAHHAELGLVREAFGSLPRRWQTVLWRTAVDHDKNTVIASELDMSPNAVAALARRARNGFRTAYIQAHASTHGIAPECEPYVPRLVELVGEDAVGAQDVRDHVDDCPRCERRLADLLAVDRDLKGALLPALLALGPGIAWVTAGHATHALGGALWLKLTGGAAGQTKKLAAVGTAAAVAVAGMASAFALSQNGSGSPRKVAASPAAHSSAADGTTMSKDSTHGSSTARQNPAAKPGAGSATAVPSVVPTTAAETPSSAFRGASTTRPAPASSPSHRTSSTSGAVRTSSPVRSTATTPPRPTSSTSQSPTAPPTPPLPSRTNPPSATHPPRPTGRPTPPPPVCLPLLCWPWNEG